MKFRSDQLGVRRRYAKYHERADVAEHCRTNRVAELLGVLVRERKMCRELSRFRKQRREGIGAEGLKLVDVDEERRPVLGRLVATRHGDELQVREQERTEKVGCLLPNTPFGEVRNQYPAMVHRVLQVKFWRDLPENIAQNGRGGELPGPIQDRRAGSARV